MRLPDTTGSVGPEIVAGLHQRASGGTFGKQLQGGRRFRNRPRGVYLLPFAERDSILTEAANKGVDLAIIVQLTERNSPRGPSDTSMVVRVFNVQTGKNVWSSKALSANQARAAIESGRDDPLADLVQDTMEHVDEYKLEPIPAFDAEQLQQRGAVLTEEVPVRPQMPVAEVRYYQVKKLLDRDQAFAWYEKLVGTELATTLADGTADEREQVVRRWAY